MALCSARNPDDMNSLVDVSRQSQSDNEGWLAHLRMRFAAREGRTYLAERHHVGPLLVQRPFHPEPNTCHAYIVHPPGGVVGGDRLELEVEAGAGSHVLLTTPAATKFYRSGGKLARQVQGVDAADAIVEWLPQETIFYRGATVRSVLGLDALAMLKDPTYLVFVMASVLACIPLTFYYSFTNAYLNEVGVMNAAGKMTLGQVSEIGMMLLMPLVFPGLKRPL